jgi:hypothetical protein
MDGNDLLTNHVRAVVLIVALAHLALHTTLNLGSNTDTITSLELLDLVTDSDDFANDLVAYTDWSGSKLSPSSSDGVYI